VDEVSKPLKARSLMKVTNGNKKNKISAGVDSPCRRKDQSQWVKLCLWLPKQFSECAAPSAPAAEIWRQQLRFEPTKE
jgi:hypothetical protein